MVDSAVEILDVAENVEYEGRLYKCLTGPLRKYRKRSEYLESAIPKGLHKKLLILNRDVVGTIEYAPTEGSGFPIAGDNVIVMNCIWVLRRAKGHNFGKRLLANMMESEKRAVGFATVALENHWSPWMRKGQMEWLGFKSVESVRVRHKVKYEGRCFTICLMWLPVKKGTVSPSWNKDRLLEGVDFCMAHPLYHPQKIRLTKIFEKC